MVTLILLFLLLFGFFMGLRRGFIMQVVHLLSFFISFIIATIYFRKLAEHLSLWIPYPDLSDGASWAMFLSSDPLEQAFYNAISFAAIFFSVKIVLQIIASMLHFIAQLPILRFINKWVGGVLGFVEMYFITFIILYILALTPIAGVQTRIEKSTLASFMIDYTPFLSKMVKSLWFTDLLSLISFQF